MIDMMIVAIGCTALGYVLGRHQDYKSAWSKWEDMGVQYCARTREWNMIQQRTHNNTGKKQYSKRYIQKYGTLDYNTIQNMNKSTTHEQ